MTYRACDFIGERIDVNYTEPQVYSKRPACPDGFSWRGNEFRIVTSLNEWVDFTRHGRMARNMSSEHAAQASRHGSWGVGRYHFHVRLSNEKLVHIYYDRAPKDADDRGGEWFLVSYLVENGDNPKSS